MFTRRHGLCTRRWETACSTAPSGPSRGMGDEYRPEMHAALASLRTATDTRPRRRPGRSPGRPGPCRRRGTSMPVWPGRINGKCRPWSGSRC